jgi:hypothetical protein
MPSSIFGCVWYTARQINQPQIKHPLWLPPLVRKIYILISSLRTRTIVGWLDKVSSIFFAFFFLPFFLSIFLSFFLSFFLLCRKESWKQLYIHPSIHPPNQEHTFGTLTIFNLNFFLTMVQSLWKKLTFLQPFAIFLQLFSNYLYFHFLFLSSFLVHFNLTVYEPNLKCQIAVFPEAPNLEC